jgi:hypothetical protein
MPAFSRLPRGETKLLILKHVFAKPGPHNSLEVRTALMLTKGQADTAAGRLRQAGLLNKDWNITDQGMVYLEQNDPAVLGPVPDRSDAGNVRSGA